MCGRFAFHSPKEAITRVFEIDFALEFQPHFNIAPSQYVIALRHSGVQIPATASSCSVEPVMLRWGLVPSWAKDPGIGHRMINARRETIDHKPAFRAAFRRRRCVILADGFYEWRRVDDRKIPTYITMKSGEPFAMAGLWEHWEGQSSTLLTCTIITTAANHVLAPVHDRMPVIFSPENAVRWMDPDNDSKAGLQQLLDSPDHDDLHYWEVGREVNNPRNDGPNLIRRLPTAADGVIPGPA
jgi:putative SOS response-associated peptidase YedK